MAITKAQQKLLKNLGQCLKDFRNAKSLTLKELGYRIDKDPQSISRVEMGDTNPTYLYLLEVCKGLEIDISEVINKLQDK